MCSWPSPAERLTAGPYLPPGAAILVRLLEQAVILDEAIFTRFSAVGDSVTGVSVQQLVGGALRHVRRPTATGYFPTRSSPTCVTPRREVMYELVEESGLDAHSAP